MAVGHSALRVSSLQRCRADRRQPLSEQIRNVISCVQRQETSSRPTLGLRKCRRAFRSSLWGLLCFVCLGRQRTAGFTRCQSNPCRLQQRAAGYPLDDVVVSARNRKGQPATLEIQVKRSIRFTPENQQFREIVAQVWESSQREAFRTEAYQLAVAIAKTTERIEKDVQQVLQWARSYSSPESFFASVKRKGFAMDAMRDFVEAFRGHLQTAGGLTDDETVRLLLKRFNVLVFDFENPGSDYHDRAQERAALVLGAIDKGRAGDLWNALVVDAENVTSAGGVRDRSALIEKLSAEGGFSFDVAPAIKLDLRDLSRSAAVVMIDQVIDAVTQHAGWDGCSDCPALGEGTCPNDHAVRGLCHQSHVVSDQDQATADLLLCL